MNTDNFFSTIALASSTQNNQSPQVNNLQAQLFTITDAVRQSINQGLNLDRSTMISMLNMAVSEILLLINMPFFISRTNIIVTGANFERTKELLSTVLLDTSSIDLNVFKSANLPIAIYHSDSNDNALIYNFADNVVSVDFEKFNEFLSLQQNECQNSSANQDLPEADKISPKNLAKFCAISSKFKPNLTNLCFIFVPASNIVTEIQFLINLCSYALNFSNSAKKLAFLKNAELTVKHVSSDDANVVRLSSPDYSVVKVSSQVNPNLTIEQLHPSVLTNWLEEVSVVNFNMNLKLYVQTIFFHLLSSTSRDLNQNREYVENLNAFLLENQDLEQDQNQKYVLDDFLYKAQETMGKLETANGNQEQELKTILGDVFDLAQQLHGLDSNIDVNVLPNNSKFKLLCRDALHCLLASKRFDDARRIIDYRNQLKCMDYVTDNLYLRYAQGEKIYETDLMDQSELSRLGYHKALLELLDFDEMSIIDQGALALDIPESERSGIIWYKIGCYHMYPTLDITNAEDAIQAFNHAMELGYKDDQLIERLAQAYYHMRYLIDEKKLLRKLAQLANMLEPSAAFTYGKLLYEEQEKKFGLNYIKLAAALEYIPAIQFYADVLWSDLEEVTYTRSDGLLKKAKQALMLYKYLESKEEDEFPMQIGHTLFLLDNYGEAIPYLKATYSSLASYDLGIIYFKGGKGAPKDLDKAQEYLESTNISTKYSEQALKTINDEQERKREQEEDEDSYSSDKDYSSSSSSYSYSSGGCFITTATCDSEGKPDNCEELTLFRNFRDQILLRSDNGRKLISEYYRIAPTIVSCIKKEPNHKEIFEEIYSKYIKPGYQLLQAKQYDKTCLMYIDCVKDLAHRYNIEIHDPNVIEADLCTKEEILDNLNENLKLKATTLK